MKDGQLFTLTIIILVAWFIIEVSSYFIYISELGVLPGFINTCAKLLPLYFLWSRGTTRKSKYGRLLFLPLAIFLVGMLFRLQHWSSANNIILTGLASLIVVYAVNYVSKPKRILSDHFKMLFVVSQTIALALRIFHWSGEMAWSLIGFFSLLLAFFTFYYSQRRKAGHTTIIPGYNFDKLK